jgi:hypothetical protein
MPLSAVHSCSRENEEMVGGGNGEHQFGSDGSGDFAAAVGQMCSLPLRNATAAENGMTHLVQIKGMVWAVQ